MLKALKCKTETIFGSLSNVQNGLFEDNESNSTTIKTD